MRKSARSFVAILVALAAAIGSSAVVSLDAAASGPPTTSVGDAYATGSGCDWTFGTSGIEQTVTYEASPGTYELTSFDNELVSGGYEYIQGGSASPQFSIEWDGSRYTGATSGWSCSSGVASTPSVGGNEIVQLVVTLTRSDVDLSVAQTYQIFPSESVIRQWTTYTNTSSGAASVQAPSFVQQNLMSSDIADTSNVQLWWMTGAACCQQDSWAQNDVTMSSSTSQLFDSASADPNGTSGNGNMGSETYIPWFSLWNSSADNGVMEMFDYMGRWQFQVGGSAGVGGLSGIVGYSPATGSDVYSMPAGDSVTSPVSTEMTYITDEDDMTNRLLDYQYRYLWDDTRSGYFGSVAAPADWCTGTQWCASSSYPWDQQGIRQKIYGLDNFETAIGIGTDWRDNGWWDAPGSWNGPDFQLTNDMLAKSGMKSIIYYPVYGANSGSEVDTAHPSWFTTAAPCASGYTQLQGDLSNPAFVTWVENELNGNEKKWGNYEFRNDSCPIENTDWWTQLAEDQNYRAIVQNFLTTNPGSAYFNVDSGGNEIGLDQVRMSSQQAFYDGTGVLETYDGQDGVGFSNASRLFPTDKLQGDPNTWSQLSGEYCNQTLWADLAMNPAFVSAQFPDQSHADTTDTQQIECARELVDTYKYLLAQGVAGQWVKQYHPPCAGEASCTASTASFTGGSGWFERTNSAGTEAAIFRIGTGATNVTVYPQGLVSGDDYTVQEQFNSAPETLTGAQLETDGISFSSIPQGQVIYLNLPDRPGAGSDTTTPSAPTTVSAALSTDDNYPDVVVSWSGATDNNWISYYNVYRDNVYLGRVAEGHVYIDHTPGASPDATYGVQAVDGDGNTSAITDSTPAHGEDVVAVDDTNGGLISYSGSWTHSTGVGGAYGGTLSASSSSSASATYSFQGSGVTAYFELGPAEGLVDVTVDGTTTTLDLYAPDSFNYSIPLFSHEFTTLGQHTITITPTGTGDSKSQGDNVEFDGLAIQTAAPGAVLDDAGSSFSYSGAGWSSSCANSSGAIDATLHCSSETGDTTTITVDTDAVRLIGQYCSSCGEADISVDGTFNARVDEYGDRGASQDGVVIWQDSWPSVGSHTITVTVDGQSSSYNGLQYKNLDSSGYTIVLDAVLADGGTGAASTSAYTEQVTSNQPSGFWRLNDHSGSTSAADTSGYGDNGTVNGSVTFAASAPLPSDPDATSATFDGETGFVDLGDPSQLQTSNGSVEAWINTSDASSGYHAIAIKWEAYGLFVNGGDLVTYDWGNNAERSSNFFVADGKWHHVVLTFHSGGTASLYVDGTDVLNTTITIANQTHDALIGSGATTPVELFKGQIADVAFYPTAFSAGQVLADYDAAQYPAATEYQDPVGYWQLDPGAGDSSPTGDNGTVHGDVTFGQPGAIPSDPSQTSASFDGSSGFIDLGNPAALQGNSGSVEAWIKTGSTDDNYHAIAIKWYAYGLFVYGGDLTTFDWSTGTRHVYSTASVANNAWHQVVLTYQSGVENGTTLYLDGEPVLKTTITTQNQSNDALIGSGSTSGVEYFNGDIGDVSFYPNVLSPAQVLTQYQGAEL